jgi:hypothetical protein
VFLLLDNPRAEALDPSTGAVRLSLSAENFQPGSTAEISPDQIALRQELLSWARTTKAIVIDPFDAFCSGNACPTTTETGQPIYKDTGHFNPAWAIDHISFIDAPLNEQR